MALEITTTIDGETYSQKQLARYEYERTLHVLHELKQLGAEFIFENKLLSDSDINWLNPEQVKQLSLNFRASRDVSKMLEIMKDVEKDAELRWKSFNEGFKYEDMITATTEMSIRGVSFKELFAVIGGAVNLRDALATNPEHYGAVGDLSKGQQIFEAFGMFGEPVLTHGTASQSFPKGFPIPRDENYPILTFGETLLKSDDTPIHVGAAHQVRPVEDGFEIKSIFFAPGKAPQIIADGHTIHFAIEIANSAKIAYENKKK